MQVSSECQKKIVDLSRGNPGATRVLCEIVATHGEESLDKFIAAGIYGSDVWIAYKDFAGGDSVKCMDAVDRCDPEMWKLIKQERGE